MNFKSCKGPFCKGKILPLDRFEKCSRNKDGFRSVCKMCYTQKNNEDFKIGICEFCGNDHECLYGSGRFCNKKCAIAFSTKSDNLFKDIDDENYKVCKYKYCEQDGKKQDIDNFYFKRNGNTRERSNICKNCNNIKAKKYRYTKNGYMKSMLRSSKTRAKNKGLLHDISFKYIETLWLNQNGKCALSKMNMTYECREKNISRHPFNMSLDRIDSSMGYTKGNVQLICNWVQTAKSDYSQSDFIEWIFTFVKNNEQSSVSNHVLVKEYLQEGKSQSEIAKLLNVSKKTVYKICKNNNLSHLNKHKEIYTKSIDVTYEELYHYIIIENLPFTTIAKIVGCSDNGIRKLYRKWKLDLY